MATTYELEDLKLNVSAEGTHFTPKPWGPYQHTRAAAHDYGDELRSRALQQVEAFASDEPHVRYVGEVVDAIATRIYERGGCTVLEQDVLEGAVRTAVVEAARAIALKYIRTVDLTVELTDAAGADR